MLTHLQQSPWPTPQTRALTGRRPALLLPPSWARLGPQAGGASATHSLVAPCGCSTQTQVATAGQVHCWARPDRTLVPPAGRARTRLTALPRRPRMGLISATFGGSETPQDAQPHTKASRTELKISVSKRQEAGG